MSNPWDEVETFVREQKERAGASQRDTETRERLDGIDAKVDGLTNALTQFLERSAPPVPPDGGGTNAPPPDGSSGDGGANSPPPPDAHGDGGGGEPPDDNLPLEVVRRFDVPRIYTGDDEPAEVQYVDPDSGETRTRKGRRKGRVATYSVEPYEPPAPDAGGDDG